MKQLMIKGTGHQLRNRDAALHHFLDNFDAKKTDVPGYVEYDSGMWRITANTDYSKAMIKSTDAEAREGEVHDADQLMGYILYRQMKDDRVVVYFVRDLAAMNAATGNRSFLAWEDVKRVSESTKVFRVT